MGKTNPKLKPREKEVQTPTTTNAEAIHDFVLNQNAKSELGLVQGSKSQQAETAKRTQPKEFQSVSALA